MKLLVETLMDEITGNVGKRTDRQHGKEIQLI